MGSGSKLMEGSYMESQSQLGAGSVLESGQRVPSGQLWAGAPARYIRDLTDREMADVGVGTEAYFDLASLHEASQFLGALTLILWFPISHIVLR